jgi:hypothetical protein
LPPFAALIKDIKIKRRVSSTSWSMSMILLILRINLKCNLNQLISIEKNLEKGLKPLNVEDIKCINWSKEALPYQSMDRYLCLNPFSAPLVV